MRVLFVHPGSLMYSEIYLRLEPLGLECIAGAVRAAGHEVRLIDLQVATHAEYFQLVRDWRPRAVGFSLSYLANVPEVVDLALATRTLLPEAFLFAGGHSASFIAADVLRHADGALACIVRGEGEAAVPRVLDALGDPRLATLPGVTTLDGSGGAGPAPTLLPDLDSIVPARDLAHHRRRYFIAEMDPCASVEFSRGCPWDCAFCSAWTFYGRSYRVRSPEAAAEDLARIREPNVFIVDDVAFIHPEHGFAIGREIERRGIRKRYYAETRCDLLVKNRAVFEYWARLGLTYMFLGLEALDEEGLRAFRKRTTLAGNLQALEVARKLGINVAINLIAGPDWDEARFETVRQWALAVPEIVHLTVQTPYPGTELWQRQALPLTTLDYRLFDMQHAVLPTKLPLDRFYEELVKTQAVLDRKHLGFAALRDCAWITAKLLARGQTNFLRMLWKFSKVYNPQRQFGDHQRLVAYEMTPPPPAAKGKVDPAGLHVHAAAHAIAV